MPSGFWISGWVDRISEEKTVVHARNGTSGSVVKFRIKCAAEWRGNVRSMKPYDYIWVEAWGAAAKHTRLMKISDPVCVTGTLQTRIVKRPDSNKAKIVYLRARSIILMSEPDPGITVEDVLNNGEFSEEE